MWHPEEPDRSTPEPDHLRKEIIQKRDLWCSCMFNWSQMSVYLGSGECLPGLRCPTVSARLPLFTLVMNAQRRPDSVIFPPTTWKHTAHEQSTKHRKRHKWQEEEEEEEEEKEEERHLESQQRPRIRGNRPILHPLIQQNSTNQTLSILGWLPCDRLLMSHSVKHMWSLSNSNNNKQQQFSPISWFTKNKLDLLSPITCQLILNWFILQLTVQLL